MWKLKWLLTLVIKAYTLQIRFESDYLVEIKLSCKVSGYTFNDSSHFQHDTPVPNMHHIS